MTYLTRIIYSAQSRGSEWGENEIDYILFLKSNVTVNPNFNEVKDLRYIGRDELDDFVRKVKEEGSGVTPWFDLIANSLLPNWWDKLMLDRLEEFKNHEEIYRFFWPKTLPWLIIAQSHFSIFYKNLNKVLFRIFKLFSCS